MIAVIVRVTVFVAVGQGGVRAAYGSAAGDRPLPERFSGRRTESFPVSGRCRPGIVRLT
jgi:hypothetical protein